MWLGFRVFERERPGKEEGVFVRGGGVGSCGRQRRSHLLWPSSSSNGAEDMDDTRQRLTRLSVPPLKMSWSWNRLNATVHAQCEWPSSTFIGRSGLRMSQNLTSRSSPLVTT